MSSNPIKNPVEEEKTPTTPQQSIDKSSQMKNLISIMQNSYQMINQLNNRIDELSTKLNELGKIVTELVSKFGVTQTPLEKNLNTLTHLFLAEVATNVLSEPQQTPLVSGSSSQPSASTQASGQPMATYGAPPPPTSDEDQHIRPSALFKKRR